MQTEGNFRKVKDSYLNEFAGLQFDIKDSQYNTEYANLRKV